MPSPIRIATWIRRKDREHFERAFAFAPHLVFEDAAHQSVDLASVNALLITGGEDISEAYLPGPVRHPELIRETDAKRDAWEFPAVRYAFERGLPILGICRGHQVLNVALGGSLHLDIPGHFFPNTPAEDRQSLNFTSGVPWWRAFPKVNSTHHQAVDRVAAGFEVEAWHNSDDVIEQISHPLLSFCVGVQYHPERSASYAPLFEAFISAASSHSRSTRS
jgi:putative glutamine amidotransferase